MNLSSIPPYWLNLILHATALGLIAWLAVLCLRHPRTRATAAGIGLLAIGLLPWLSALRTPEAPMPAVLKAPVQALPTWKITLQDTAPKAPAAVIPIAPVEAPPSKPVELPSFRPWQILAALWLAGTSLCLLLDTRAALRLRTWRKSQTSPTDAEWDTLAPLTRMGRRSVLLSDVSISPCVVGVFAPCLIIPRVLLGEAEHQPLRWALRHEAEHLRGHDLRWLAAFRLIRAIFWWNPFVHRLVARWTEAREQICDLHATPTPEERASYSEFLIALSSRSTRMQPGTLAMADRGPVSRLKRRLLFLLTSPTDRPLRKSFIATALLLLLICGMALPSFGIDSPPAGVPAPDKVETPAPVAEVAKVAPKDEEPSEDPNTLGQIKLNTRLVFSNESPGRHGDVLRGLNQEKYFATLATRPGYKLETCPSVTARGNQEATIEIIWENPAHVAPPLTPAQIAEEIDQDQKPAWPPRNDRSRAYWSPSPPQVLGFVLNMNPKVVKDHLHLETRALYSQVPGKDNVISIKPEGEISWKDVRRHDAALTSDLKSGDVVICSFGEIKPGRYLTLFIRVEAIDRTGRPVPEGFGKRFPDPLKPAPAVPAPTLIATGAVFDFDKPQAEQPEGAKPLGLTGLLNEEQFEILKRETPARVRDLPAVKLTSGERRSVLWKNEVPRFWLGGTVPETGEVIDLDLRGATFPGKEPASASQLSLGLYNGQYVAIALDPPPGVMRRELYVKIAIEKPVDK